MGRVSLCYSIESIIRCRREGGREVLLPSSDMIVDTALALDTEATSAASLRGGADATAVRCDEDLVPELVDDVDVDVLSRQLSTSSSDSSRNRAWSYGAVRAVVIRSPATKEKSSPSSRSSAFLEFK